jgi:hypothetical protein
MTDHDKTGLECKSSNWPEKTFYVSVRSVDQLDIKIFLDKLNKILQSNQFFFFSMLDIFVTHIKNTYRIKS